MVTEIKYSNAEELNNQFEEHIEKDNMSRTILQIKKVENLSDEEFLKC